MFHVEQSTQKKTLATPKDYLVSGETFSVLLDPVTQVAQTLPAPEANKMEMYYDSQAYISHGNTKQSFVDQLYAFAKGIMLRQKEHWIKRQKLNAVRYFDFGCGTGEFVKYLNERNWQAVGLEPSQKARAVFQLKEVVSNLNELEEKEFDAIGLWHVLEHLPDPKNTIQQLSHFMSNDTKLFLAVPNFKSFDAKHYHRYWAAYDVPRHLWHFSSTGIIQLCNQEGFRLSHKRGMLLDAFYISYLSEKHKGSRFPFLCGMFWGMVSNIKALSTGEYSAMLYVFTKQE